MNLWLASAYTYKFRNRVFPLGSLAAGMYAVATKIEYMKLGTKDWCLVINLQVNNTCASARASWVYVHIHPSAYQPRNQQQFNNKTIN